MTRMLACCILVMLSGCAQQQQQAVPSPSYSPAIVIPKPHKPSKAEREVIPKLDKIQKEIHQLKGRLNLPE